MKIYLLISLSFLLAPVFVFAASDDVTLTTDVVINVAGINFTISGSSATLASIVVNSGSFTVGLESGSSITVASADRRTFTLSPGAGAFTQSTACTASQSTLTLSGTGTVTIEVTPTSSTCSGDGGGIISGGGGYSAPVVPPQVVAQAPIAVVPSPIAVAVSPIFTASLKLGSSDADVKHLQKLLNSDPDTKVADSGFGSPGNETEYFGSLTEKAVQRFQCKYNIVCSGSPESIGYGYIGPKTRAKIQEVFK